jgi:multicomponent K+:H+ antiporter subunit E
MNRWLPFPLLWALLLALWLLLYETLAPAHVIFGAIVALVAVWGLHRLQERITRIRRPFAALELLWMVFTDIVRSNVGVGQIALNPSVRGRTAGFVDIPLRLRNPAGLAALACIITSTPGTSWARYDSRSGVLTIHVLDLLDVQSWIHIITDRYERRLMEIFT